MYLNAHESSFPCWSNNGAPNNSSWIEGSQVLASRLFGAHLIAHGCRCFVCLKWQGYSQYTYDIYIGCVFTCFAIGYAFMPDASQMESNVMLGETAAYCYDIPAPWPIHRLREWITFDEWESKIFVPTIIVCIKSMKLQDLYFRHYF